MRPQTTYSLCFLLTMLSAACNDSAPPEPASGGPPVDPPPIGGGPSVDPPPIGGGLTHGHFRGYVMTGWANYGAEGLVTADGEVRIYLGASVSAGSGVLRAPDPDASNPNAQFVGHVQPSGSRRAGVGLVIPQFCDALSPGPFCDGSVPAEITINALQYPNTLTGEIRFSGDYGAETWLFDMTLWSIYYPAGAGQADLAGRYWEVLAPFARGDDVIVTIDANGYLFFQSPVSGCTGNGVLTPRAGGRQYVFDAKLVIENCNADYASLNAEFGGLVTGTQDGYWSYDYYLVMLLSSTGSSAPQVALTMYSGQTY